MRHFGYLDAATDEALFHRIPERVELSGDPQLLGVALGATLYTPAVRPDLDEVVRKQAARGVTSIVLDLEDAVADDAVEDGQRNLVRHLRGLARDDPGERPMIFSRIRHPEQIGDIVAALGDDVGVLTGFVVPKFDDVRGPAFLDALDAVGGSLYVMPVLESPSVIFREARLEALDAIRRLLDKHRRRVLAVRIGATDLCALYGLRRDRDLTIYDLRLVADAISDIVNVLGRADAGGFLVSAPVWEYFEDHERLFKPQLRATPFERQHQQRLRQRIVTRDIDRLIREIVLDKANGLTGKTVIHPSHVAAVHALSAVTREEYADACDIVDSDRQGGVQPSGYGNKMNELKPHRAWAERTIRRARVFGVLREEASFIDLLASALR